MQINQLEYLKGLYRNIILKSRSTTGYRKHYALGIYTPSEVLNGENPKQKFTEIFKEAAIERRKTNKLGCEAGCEA
jgi:hypothetical protein